MFESGAILIYLGMKTGMFYPADLRKQVPVLEWLMWQMGGFGPMPGQVHHFLQVENPTTSAMGWSATQRKPLGCMACWTGGWQGRSFVADEVSIADFAILGWAWRHERHKIDLAEYPNVKRWYDGDDGAAGDGEGVRGGAELTFRV